MESLWNGEAKANMWAAGAAACGGPSQGYDSEVWQSVCLLNANTSEACHGASLSPCAIRLWRQSVGTYSSYEELESPLKRTLCGTGLTRTDGKQRCSTSPPLMLVVGICRTKSGVCTLCKSRIVPKGVTLFVAKIVVREGQNERNVTAAVLRQSDVDLEVAAVLHAHDHTSSQKRRRPPSRRARAHKYVIRHTVKERKMNISMVLAIVSIEASMENYIRQASRCNSIISSQPSSISRLQCNIHHIGGEHFGQAEKLR